MDIAIHKSLGIGLLQGHHHLIHRNLIIRFQFLSDMPQVISLPGDAVVEFTNGLSMLGGSSLLASRDWRWRRRFLLGFTIGT